MIYYTIYKVTNKVNGKIYIGSHKTKNPNDNYMGSGKYLNYAFKKHGIENFTKEILYIFDTPELMYAKEAELVNEDFIAESNTYNLKIGGFGGFDYLNSDKFDNPTHTPEHRQMMAKCRLEKYSPDDRKSIARKGVLTRAKRYPVAARERALQGHKVGTFSFKGKKHSEETKRKISKASKERLRDPKNHSQFGTRWIYNVELKKSKKIPKNQSLPDGWHEGRKVKFSPTANEIKKEKNRVKKQQWIDKLKNVMYYYRDNDISMRELSKKFNVGQNVYTSFERYFPQEYHEIAKSKSGNSSN